MESRAKRHYFHIALVGNRYSGKTALIDQFQTRHFSPQYKATQGTEICTAEIPLESRSVTLKIWDIAPNPHFGCQAEPSVARYLDCCVLVYDIGDRHSFGGIETWRTVIASARREEKDSVSYILVGNKADKEGRKVGWGEAQTWARSQGDLPFFETSARLGSNVSAVFEAAAIAGIRNY